MAIASTGLDWVGVFAVFRVAVAMEIPLPVKLLNDPHGFARDAECAISASFGIGQVERFGVGSDAVRRPASLKLPGASKAGDRPQSTLRRVYLPVARVGSRNQ